VQGRLGGEYVRQALSLTSWEAASDLIHGWEATGKIGVELVEVPSVADAVERFLKDAESRGVRPPTMKKYRRVLQSELVPYCASRHIAKVDRLTVDLLRQFRESLPNALSTLQKKIESLRTFMTFCVDSDWIKQNPAKKVRVKNVGLNPTMPFTKEEIDRLLRACATFRGKGERLHALIGLLRHTGLRIADAVGLERARIQDNRIFLYTAKTGTPILCPLPAAIVKELNRIPGERHFFWNGSCKLSTLLGNYYRAFLALAVHAKVDHPHFHRFRDTFAVSLLEKGVSLENVSVLLGHSSIRVTEKHYAPWVKSRQDMLEAAVRKAW
jgi:site-specific recombinase XerD